MQIELTREQYKLLVQMIYYAHGSLQVSGILEKNEHDASKITDFKKYIYSKCKDFGFKDEIDEAPEEIIDENILDSGGVDGLIVNASLQDTINTLVHDLVTRDIERIYGDDPQDNDEYYTKINELQNKYRDEIKINGFDRLIIDEK